MTDSLPATPPRSKKELFSRMRGVIAHDWYDIPDEKAYNGTGGAGCFLEALLGARAGKSDIPDSTGWEIKTYTKQTNLVTLFHKEARPENIMRHMVRKWGWNDAKGRKSFRHTISGKSDRFIVENDSNQVVVRSLTANGPVPYWTHDDLLNAASKLRRLLLVKAHRSVKRVKFSEAHAFENFKVSDFIYEMTRGTVCIDFDAREATAGSGGLRNHGTKFRVHPRDIYKLYASKQPLG